MQMLAFVARRVQFLAPQQCSAVLRRDGTRPSWATHPAAVAATLRGVVAGRSLNYCSPNVTHPCNAKHFPVPIFVQHYKCASLTSTRTACGKN